MELPVHQPNLRILGDIIIEYCSPLVSSTVAAAEGRGGLNGPFPYKNAVLIAAGVFRGVPRGNVVSESRDAASVQLTRRAEWDNNVFHTAVWADDGHCDGSNHGIRGGAVPAADELEVVAASDPIAGA